MGEHGDVLYVVHPKMRCSTCIWNPNNLTDGHRLPLHATLSYVHTVYSKGSTRDISILTLFHDFKEHKLIIFR